MEKDIKKIHDNVVRYICEQNKNRFEVLNNLKNEEVFVGGLFPDIIFKDKATGKLKFILEVKRNGGIAQCLQQWKTAPVTSAILYIIVPKDELSNAKSIAQVVGIPVRFGYYEIKKTGEVIVKYE